MEENAKKTRVSVRALIAVDDGIVLIHRVKDGREYYVVPGGGVKDGETHEDTVKRELLEELGIEVGNSSLKKLYKLKTEWDSQINVHYFMFCEYNSSEIGTEKELKFKEDIKTGGTRKVIIVKLADLDKFKGLIKPEGLAEAIISDLMLNNVPANSDGLYRDITAFNVDAKGNLDI